MTSLNKKTKQSDFKDFVSISVVKGGSAANTLVKVMDSPWGRKLYGRTLINNIAQSVYTDRDTLAKQLRKNIPPFANVAARDFEFAFKIRVRGVFLGCSLVGVSLGLLARCGVWGCVSRVRMSAGDAHSPTHQNKPKTKQDKRDARDAGRPTNLTVLPSEAELSEQPLDKFKRFWTTDLLAAFTGGDAPAAAQ